MKVIFLNGAPKSGKDTTAKLLMDYGADGTTVLKEKFSDPIKSAVHALFGYPLDPDALEEVKDVPNERMLGKTPRAWYIHQSEQNKKMGGNLVHGILLKDRLERARLGRHGRTNGVCYTIPDSGFSDECTLVADYVGRNNCIILRLLREGCDYSADKNYRSHISIPGVKTIFVPNNGDIRDLRKYVVAEFSAWINDH